MDKFYITLASSDAVDVPQSTIHFNRVWEIPVGLNDRYLNYEMRVTNCTSSVKQTIRTASVAQTGQDVSLLIEMGIVQSKNNLNTAGKQIVGVVKTRNTSSICGMHLSNPNAVSIGNIVSGQRIQFKLVGTNDYDTAYRTGGGIADFVIGLELTPVPEDPKAFSRLKSLSIQ
jgi:hypothetical protein